MDVVLPYLVVTGALGGVLGLFTCLAVLARRRGVAGSAVRGAMASYEEAWQASAYDSHYEIQAQADRTTPVPAPDAPWRDSEDSTRPVARGGRGGLSHLRRRILG